MNVKFWRRWHRWIGLPTAVFLLWAASTGVAVAFTEFFGAEESLREAMRDLVSPVTTTSPGQAWSEPIARALQAVNSAAPGVPIDKIEQQFKGEQPTVTVFTGKPGGGEDRKFVIDAKTGSVLSSEAYADKPFLYRLHSGEAFGDGGLVFAMGWGTALAFVTVGGLFIYWRMYSRMRRRNLVGIRRFFW